MGSIRVQGPLLLFLLGTSCWARAQQMQCQTGTVTSIEEDPSRTFNWTSEKVETCDNGALCQETVILIKAGAKTAVLATKSCAPRGTEAVTFIQHALPPGLVATSYSSYCSESLCNNMGDVSQFWKPQKTPAAITSTALRCPTCVALGTCVSAPSLPCPNGTSRCYQGQIKLTGGITSTVEVKGCSALNGCKLMGRISEIGPVFMKETCTHQPLFQPRKAESRAPWLFTSLWLLELLLPLLLLPLVHFL